MSRIVVFSPHAKRLHVTAYEGTLAKAAQVRGATVEYILCDGQIPECDEYWEASAGGRARPLDICVHCSRRAESCIRELGMPFRWLGQFVSREERSTAFEWAQGVPFGNLQSAEYQGYPVGDWVLSSVVSYFRHYPPEMENWRVASVYRAFLFSAVFVLIGLKRYLSEAKPSAALLFNGRQSTTRVAFEVFRENGVRVLTHEYPFYMNGHLMLKPNARCWSPEPFVDFWKDWKNVPLVSSELEAARRWLMGRRYAQGLSWHAFNRPYVERLSILDTLGLSPGKSILALFTSSTEEIVGDAELQGAFPSQNEWVSAIIECVRVRNDVELVIRVHPHLASSTHMGKARAEYAFYETIRREATANVTVVMPDDAFNSYALMDQADVGLTYGATPGIEMAMLGKPVVLGSRAFYENGERVFTVREKAELEALVHNAIETHPNIEIMREAFRLAYRYVFQFERPFPLVKKTGVTDVSLSYNGTEALQPGADAAVDGACRFLLGEGGLFEGPDGSQCVRNTIDEDQFLGDLMCNLEPFRDTAYERALRRHARVEALGRKIQGAVGKLPFGLGGGLAKVGAAVYRPIWHHAKKRKDHF